MQKNTNKKHTSRYVLKIFKKELFIYLQAFLKHLKKKQRTKYLDESYLLHHEPLFLCIFFLST